jgi:hypothetical protein
MALDNLIRRKLRVGGPMDAKEVVKALQSFYQEESQAMQRGGCRAALLPRGRHTGAAGGGAGDAGRGQTGRGGCGA